MSGSSKSTRNRITQKEEKNDDRRKNLIIITMHLRMKRKAVKPLIYNYLSLGLNYIERQQKYLWIHLLWPLITIILQIFNTIFLFNLQNNPSGFQPNQPYQPNQPNQFHQIHIGPIDQITPSIILIILCIIALIKFISLLSLRKKVIVYRLQQSTDNSTSETFNDDENEVFS